MNKAKIQLASNGYYLELEGNRYTNFVEKEWQEVERILREFFGEPEEKGEGE